MSEHLQSAFGQAVKQARQSRGWSATELAAHTTPLVGGMSRATLERTEAGKRAATVPEWLAIAASLGIAPGALLADLTDEQQVEVLPGHTMPPMALWSWISGLGADTTEQTYTFDVRLRAWQRRHWARREFEEVTGWLARTPQREQWFQDHPEWFEDETLQRWNGPPPEGEHYEAAKGEANREGYGAARVLVSACLEARRVGLPFMPMTRTEFDRLAGHFAWRDPESWADDLGIEPIEWED